MEKIVYSLDEEWYYDYDDMTNMIEESEDEIETIYQGEANIQTHSDFLNATSVIQDMQERAYELGEFAEGYLDDISVETKEKLHKHILSFFNENISQPTFFTVGKTKTISIKEFNSVQ